jgi:hypothetical protein
MPAKKTIRYLFNLFLNSFPFYTCFLIVFEILQMWQIFAEETWLFTLITQVFSSFFFNKKTLSQSKSSIGVKYVFFYSFWNLQMWQIFAEETWFFTLKTQVFSSFFFNKKNLSRSKSSIGVKSLFISMEISTKKKSENQHDCSMCRCLAWSACH